MTPRDRFCLQSAVACLLLGGLWLMLPTGKADPASTSPAQLYQCTRESSLVMALQTLESVGEGAVVKTLLDRGTHVLFRNMESFGPMYKANDAITWVGDDGSQTIYISSRHTQAPPQALAALVAHELLHNDSHNSLAEETVGWQRESTVWREMLAHYPNLATIPIKSFPLVDRLNAIVLLEKQDKLTQTVESNPVYQALPQHSPGF